MLKGATGEDSFCNEDGNAYDQDGSPECGLARLGLGALGVLFAVGGGPFGAVKRAGLRQGASSYVPSAFGQILLGGLGYALGSSLGGDEGRVVRGLAVGAPLAAIGAAGGALLGAPGGTLGRGVLQWREGEWRLGLPDARVRLGAMGDRPVVNVSLLSVGL